MTTTRKPAEVPFERIELMFRLAGYYLSGNYKPPVFERGAGFGIRVLDRHTSTLRTTRTSYGYFEINADGVVTASPRGWAREFNRKRITGLPEALVQYSTPDGGRRAMSDFSPKAQADAIEHLIFKLNQIATDAEQSAETQEAAAEGTRSFDRRLRYEEAAEFQRALAETARSVVPVIAHEAHVRFGQNGSEPR